MIIGITGGIMLAGLLMGAITGSQYILISCTIAGLLLAKAISAAKIYKEQITTNNKLKQFPSYKY